MNESSGRLENALVAILIFGLVYGVAKVLALLVRAISKKTIDTKGYYAGATILAIVLLATLRTLAMESRSVAIPAPTQPTAIGLDAPFIAPPESRMESFVGQLSTARDGLPSTDKAAMDQAVNFLAFSVAINMQQSDAAKFGKQSDLDLAAKSYLKLYQYARAQGNSMTLRKYVNLATNLKKQRPAWWGKFSSLQASSPSP